MPTPRAWFESMRQLELEPAARSWLSRSARLPLSKQPTDQTGTQTPTAQRDLFPVAILVDETRFTSSPFVRMYRDQ